MSRMSRLAARTGRIDASGIRRIFDLASSLNDPINLSVGQPAFDVPPVVKKAAHEAIDAGRNFLHPNSRSGRAARNPVRDRGTGL